VSDVNAGSVSGPPDQSPSDEVPTGPAEAPAGPAKGPPGPAPAPGPAKRPARPAKAAPEKPVEKAAKKAATAAKKPAEKAATAAKKKAAVGGTRAAGPRKATKAAAGRGTGRTTGAATTGTTRRRTPAKATGVPLGPRAAPEAPPPLSGNEGDAEPAPVISPTVAEVPPPPPPPAPSPPPTWSPPSPSPSSPPPGGDWPPPPPGGPPGPPQGWAPPAYGPPPSPGLDGMAVAALVLGIVSIPLFVMFVPAILAIVFGAISRHNVKSNANRTGAGMAVAGLVLGIVSLIGAVIFLIAAIASDDTFDDTVRYSRLQPGDCYEDPGSTAGEVRLQSCSDEHDREAFAVIDHPAPEGASFPGRESLRRYADDECTARFSAYVGRAYDQSQLEVVFILPSRDAWDDLDFRRIVCGVSNADDEPLVGTVRGSAT
jgi:uncharacterized protein DUF4190/putative regulator of septum formation